MEFKIGVNTRNIIESGVIEARQRPAYLLKESVVPIDCGVVSRLPLDAYAEFANTTPDRAREIRDVFYPHDHLMVDFVKGLDTAMIDGIALRAIATPLTVEQLERLFQVPPPIK